MRERFLAGALANGVDAAVAEEVFGQLQGFATYGFCKSHAAAFALIAYQTLWLKAHYPAEFYCALLNHQPMGFYSPEVVVGDAKRHGITVLRPDVNAERGWLYAGAMGRLREAETGRRGDGEPSPSSPVLPCTRACGSACATCTAWARRGGRGCWPRAAPSPFADLADFCRRTRLPRPLVGDLIRAGALDGFGGPKRQLLWTLGGLHYDEEALVEAPDTPADLPDLTEREAMAWDYELLGLSPDDHPLRLWRARLRGQGVLDARPSWQRSRRAARPGRRAWWSCARRRPPPRATCSSRWRTRPAW